MSSKTITIPVQGMTCASCSSNVERALYKVEGVSEVNVNLATERAKVTVTKGDLPLDSLVEAVSKAGYDVPIEKIMLPIGGMTCASCVAHVEGALDGVPGVIAV
ncbi:MAG: copper ion binding protein, partial [Candidatus Hermodarchaeia archaeon]